MTKKEAKQIIKRIKTAKGQIPYDGDYSNCDHDFLWFYVKSEEDWEAICKCFTLEDFQKEEVKKFPEWVCLEDDNCSLCFEEYTSDGDVYGIRINTLSSCKKAFQNLMDALNDEVANHMQTVPVSKNISNDDRMELLGEIIDIFDDFLEEKDVRIESSDQEMEENGEDDESNAARIYGSDYDLLSCKLSRLLQAWNFI